MRKKILVSIIAIATIGLIYHFVTEKSEIEKLREKHAKFLKNHPYNKSLQFTKKERKTMAMPPNKYFEQEYLLEMNPATGRTHPENLLEIRKELLELRKLQKVPGNDNNWIERGPNNVGGRTRVVMFDPNDATHKRVFAGGVSGGLWVNNDITDANSSWTRVGIDENLSISCMTVDPNNSQIMYVGTGESYTGGDALGNGVWKSTDGGTTWTNILRDDFNADLSKRFHYVNDIVAWDNNGSTVLFVGIGGAYHSQAQDWLGYDIASFYKSIDGGNKWTTITLPTPQNSPYEPNDMEVGPDNTLWVATTANVYGHGGGTILKSIDGNTFTVAHTLTATNARRTEIAVSKQNGGTIYVLARLANLNNEGTAYVTPYLSMIKTTDNFTSTTNLTLPSDADTGISSDDFTRGQAYYDLVIEVDPTDDTKLYVGGIDLFRSTNSGSTWKQISKWSNNPNLHLQNIPLVHADQHGWAFHPTDANKAVIGNDGGVYYASSLVGAETTTDAINARNNNYNVTQFYHGELGQNTGTNLLLSGAQDNGTQLINNGAAGVNPATRVYGGDGAYSFIDKEEEYMIVSYVYNTKARLNLPYDGNGLELDDDSDTGSFINPQELDDNLDILYANASAKNGSFDSIVRYTGIKSGQTLVKKRLGNVLLDGSTTALKVSPFTTTSTTLLVGTVTGKLLKVENANTATPVWSNITGSFLGSISSIEFGATEDEIMVTFHNYGATNIWFTENGGLTWQNKEGDLPDFPVKTIMMNPLNTDEVIIGTHIGVWKTSNFKNASPNWIHSYNGMSNVAVTSFSLRNSDNTVMATTYGRGMFTGAFEAGVASVDDVLKETKVFAMYPTVSDGNFTVFAKNTLGKSTLLLFDVNGKEVFKKQLDFTQEVKQPISVNLKSGVYLVNLIDSNNRKATSKVVIK